MTLETLHASREGAVLFANIAAPQMNLLGPELVRDLVSLIQQAEADDAIRVLVFKSADKDYFISHVDVTRIAEYREQAAKLAGEPLPAPPVASARAEWDDRTDRGACPPETSSCWRATCVSPRASQRVFSQFEAGLRHSSPVPGGAQHLARPGRGRAMEVMLLQRI